jgi:dihydropteroate synthase
VREAPAFSALGLALAARALPVPEGPERAARLPRRVAFALDAGGLGADARGALQALPSARFGVYVPADAPPGALPRELLFACDADELAALESEVADVLRAAQAALDRPRERPALMGIVNVTPDSFSDGGRYLAAGAAIEHGLALAAQGAALLDVGGESTRPGAAPVEPEVQLERVLPVLAGLAGAAGVRLSIDTTRASVARAALDAGATVVNDVSAGTEDARMLPLVAERGAEIILMHRQGLSAGMQADPRYGDPLADVSAWLRARVATCLKAGVALSKITLDPGIGFGKRLDHNLSLIRRLPELCSLGRPLCLGVSRKAFIGHLTGAEEQRDWRGRSRRDDPADRLGGTAAALAACVRGGAEILRVHDVRAMGEAAAVAHALVHPRTHDA